MKRASGILLPVFSLPSEYGIGCFSKDAYTFVDMLKNAGQSYWQILPLGPTGYGDSPYQSFSTFAGNPYFIDLNTLVDEGLLTRQECGTFDFGGKDDEIDYEKIYLSRFKALKLAYDRFDQNDDYRTFVHKNQFWLEDYALYMAIKDHNNGVAWKEWEEPLRDREPQALAKAREELAEAVDFYRFQQYEFDKQWTKLHTYANQQGIKIIGDIPIYVAFDSADTWASPQLFQFDENNNPTGVAGCPPDGFSATGQLWGNPLYRWDYHKETGYAWWIQRIAYSLKLYDVVRIDHFRGFDEYYAIPYGDATAENGKWMPGPGMDLFHAIEEKLGRPDIIAEDLGFLTPTVLELLKDSGFPGMKVLQFAFDARESSNYLPHTYTENCVVYTGTHDNDTTRGWYHEVGKEARDFAKEYMCKPRLDEDSLAQDFIAMAMGSVARLCVIPMQDYLNLGTKARINLPSTLGGNWVWRLKKDQLSEEVFREMGRVTKLYGRMPEEI
ncbi:4-alpha-glucanotransferase [Catenibacillus scindens]|uniref:4-alpha-glucanotransferase n=1 Tax=Catenibacillus scindens TaxID=673271 RepID=A0A7W8HD45_9FIRM|nr:4-alpha-glucanotransferase [Catenibacillus scindens]MBB5266115.1 4-alpha-glucanotransferase [Catenibacillus scindens]